MTPRHLVSLSGLDDLREITLEDGQLRIGALVTPAQLQTSSEVALARPELLDAVRVFGTPQVRNRATVGGNLCTAASCADFTPLLMALGAHITIATPEGSRGMPLAEFFGDHRSTHLGPGHILSEVIVSERTRGEGAAYEAFGLRASNSITVAGAAAHVRMEEGRCTGARLALGAVAPTAFLVQAAETALVGSSLGDDDLAGVGAAAAEASAPLSDIRGSAEHRRELVERLSIRALESARERAR
jgi:carbon-monoxide dehydrogenase medium subunit